ncbi:MAG TPA: hypothetical protein VKM93_02445 [Terriglobia bacterium]|nr:hypothetical protein [Terriglobia bacterium]
MLGSLLVPEGAGPGRFPGPVVPIGFRPPGGDEIHGPGSQNILVCSWDAVTVIVATLNWFGPDTPVAGKTVTFSFTNAGGLGTSVGISTGPGGTGSTSAPGGSVSVKTNAQGEAVIYVHSALKGTITLHASAGWSQGDDIVINFK